MTLPRTVGAALAIFEIDALFSRRRGSGRRFIIVIVTGSTNETSVGISFGMTRVGFGTPVAERSSAVGAVCVCCAVGTDEGLIWANVRGVNYFFIGY